MKLRDWSVKCNDGWMDGWMDEGMDEGMDDHQMHDCVEADQGKEQGPFF